VDAPGAERVRGVPVAPGDELPQLGELGRHDGVVLLVVPDLVDDAGPGASDAAQGVHVDVARDVDRDVAPTVRADAEALDGQERAEYVGFWNE